jgi:putative ABC transport system substrate-binding protein
MLPRRPWLELQMRFDRLKRREFIAAFGGAAAWPFVAGAQQSAAMRGIGVLMAFGENDPEGSKWLSGFTKELQDLGWTGGKNVNLHVRWGAGNPERIQTLAKELVSLKPNVILAHGTPVTRALHRETRTIPIVFVTVGDPVGDGFVTNLSRPGGNITGFIFLEAEVGGNWLELLTEMAPDIKVAAAMFNPDTAPRRGTYYLPSFEAAAKTHNVEPITLPVLSIADIENGIALLGDGRAGGLVATGDPFLLIDRKATIALAAPKKGARRLFSCRFCPRRRLDFLWTGQRGYISACSSIR